MSHSTAEPQNLLFRTLFQFCGVRYCFYRSEIAPSNLRQKLQPTRRFVSPRDPWQCRSVPAACRSTDLCGRRSGQDRHPLTGPTLLLPLLATASISLRRDPSSCLESPFSMESAHRNLMSPVAGEMFYQSEQESDEEHEE